MAFYDPVNRGQSEAGASAHTLSREKGIKDASYGLFIHTCACISKG